jgi:hypothetical protein
MTPRLASTIAGLTLAATLATPATAATAAASATEGARGGDAFLALQATRRVDRVPLPGARGEIVLTQLAPAANAWMLLSLPAADGRAARRFHLENPRPADAQVSLDTASPGTLLIASEGTTTRCPLWPDTALAAASRLQVPYVPLCDGRLLLRNAVSGHRSTLEATTEFLRDHVWGGERVIGFVKNEFYRDAFAEHAASTAATATARPGADAAPPGAPPPARRRHGPPPPGLVATGLGLALDPPGRSLQPGDWYRAAGLDGVWVSATPPGAVADGLGTVESEALAFLVAFDLARFDLGFALGTDHPRLGWSDRVLPTQRDERLPGPDGVDSAAPLVRTGMLAPPLLDRVVATFTGGFKREHGAFRSGALASANHGSHYGFIEQGVVFSRLQPGLATLLVGNDGAVEMTTWRPEDEHRIGALRHARQNGVPLVEPGPAGVPVAGRLVDQWGAGNWSGSQEEQLRTLRAGACIVASEGRRFLVYGYFSSATPRAMARVFMAYGCGYAMHLDMNALEHTYLALYPRTGAQLGAEHLVPGMSVLDTTQGATLVPRFLGMPDDRDFFYLTRRKATR